VFNNDTELIFPSRVIPTLSDLRGDEWKEIVSAIADTPPQDIGKLAMVLIMVRMCGCLTCNADAFRAMRGCSQCARQTIRRYRGEDKELIAQLDTARREIQSYLKELEK
jgi:hypothetical protein